MDFKKCKYYDSETGWCAFHTFWTEAMPSVTYCGEGLKPGEPCKDFVERPMTPEEFAETISAITGETEDEESTHIKKDDLMCKLLESLGYQKGVEIFKKSSKW